MAAIWLVMGGETDRIPSQDFAHGFRHAIDGHEDHVRRWRGDVEHYRRGFRAGQEWLEKMTTKGEER